MKIKLLRMPLKFSTAEGEMEVTVRPCGTGPNGNESHQFAAAAAFIAPGARALQRVQITRNLKSHGDVMNALLSGFDPRLARHEPESLERRVLESLCRSKGVEEIDEDE